MKQNSHLSMLLMGMLSAAVYTTIPNEEDALTFESGLYSSDASLGAEPGFISDRVQIRSAYSAQLSSVLNSLSAADDLKIQACDPLVWDVRASSRENKQAFSLVEGKMLNGSSKEVIVDFAEENSDSNRVLAQRLKAEAQFDYSGPNVCSDGVRIAFHQTLYLLVIKGNSPQYVRVSQLDGFEDRDMSYEYCFRPDVFPASTQDKIHFENGVLSRVNWHSFRKFRHVLCGQK